MNNFSNSPHSHDESNITSQNGSHLICKPCTFHDICLHDRSGENEHARLSPIVYKQIKLKSKDVLFHAEQHFKSVYAIYQGGLKTFKTDSHGKGHIQQFYLCGEIIGLDAIHAGVYQYTAVALTNTVICEIPFHQLADFITNIPYLQNQLFLAFSKRLCIEEHITGTSAKHKLAQFLIQMAERPSSRNRLNCFHLPMSRYDIGAYLGLTPETISRLFTRFQNANILLAENKKITILDFDALQSII